MANIINLHPILLLGVKPSTRHQTGTIIGGLFEVAAHRDWPFQTVFTAYVTVPLIVGSPRQAVSLYAVPRSPDFPPPVSQRLCSVHLTTLFYRPKPQIQVFCVSGIVFQICHCERSEAIQWVMCGRSAHCIIKYWIAAVAGGFLAMTILWNRIPRFVIAHATPAPVPFLSSSRRIAGSSLRQQTCSPIHKSPVAAGYRHPPV